MNFNFQSISFFEQKFRKVHRKFMNPETPAVLDAEESMKRLTERAVRYKDQSPAEPSFKHLLNRTFVVRKRGDAVQR